MWFETANPSEPLSSRQLSNPTEHFHQWLCDGNQILRWVHEHVEVICIGS
jgi:hypothetical protein